MTDEQTTERQSPRERITEAVAAWPAVAVGSGRFGSTRFTLSGREFGHVHERLADIMFPMPVREQLLAEGLTGPHHVVPNSPSATTFRVTASEDVDHAIWLFRLAYLAAVARRHAHSEWDASPVDVEAGLDELGPSVALRAAFEVVAAT